MENVSLLEPANTWKLGRKLYNCKEVSPSWNKEAEATRSRLAEQLL